MPREAPELVSYIQDNTSIPVLGHTEGSATSTSTTQPISMAEEIAYDARRSSAPAVCNAVETLLVGTTISPRSSSAIADRYETADVEIRGDERTRELADVEAATEADWDTEYGDLIVSIRAVDSLETAIDHITTHGSEAHRVDRDRGRRARASTFMRSLDSASVSTTLDPLLPTATGSVRCRSRHQHGQDPRPRPRRFRGTDHQEGKYHLEGDGQLVATYAGEDKPFTHQEVRRRVSPRSPLRRIGPPADESIAFSRLPPARRRELIAAFPVSFCRLEQDGPLLDSRSIRSRRFPRWRSSAVHLRWTVVAL